MLKYWVWFVFKEEFNEDYLKLDCFFVVVNVRMVIEFDWV